MPISQQGNFSPINSTLNAALKRTISDPRLGPYLEAGGFNFERGVHLYLWNVTIGQSFHFPLQATEVALRNAISDAICVEFGSMWWRQSEARRFLDEKALDILSDTRKRLVRRDIKPTSGEMVAHLSFGFWVGLLAKKHAPKLWSKQLGRTFPALPNGITLPTIYTRANRVLDLRNRIFHHEPLIKYDLSARYSETMQLLKWICPETQAWVKAHSSVPKVIRLKP